MAPHSRQVRAVGILLSRLDRERVRGARPARHGPIFGMTPLAPCAALSSE